MCAVLFTVFTFFCSAASETEPELEEEGLSWSQVTGVPLPIPGEEGAEDEDVVSHTLLSQALEF